MKVLETTGGSAKSFSSVAVMTWVEGLLQVDDVGFTDSFDDDAQERTKTTRSLNMKRKRDRGFDEDHHSISSVAFRFCHDGRIVW